MHGVRMFRLLFEYTTNPLWCVVILPGPANHWYMMLKSMLLRVTKAATMTKVGPLQLGGIVVRLTHL